MAKFTIINAADAPGRAAPEDFNAWLDHTYAVECSLASKTIPVVRIRKAAPEGSAFVWKSFQVDDRERKYVKVRNEDRRPRSCSSGYCYWGRHISLVLGTDEEDRKLVALHELAHWLRPRREGHSAKFWTLAFDLFEKYKLNMAYAAKRSADYKAQARKEAQKRGIVPEQKDSYFARVYPEYSAALS